MAANTEVLTEPLLLYLSFATRPDSQMESKQQPLAHAIGVQEITRVGIAGPMGDARTASLQAISSSGGGIAVRTATAYVLEIGFDAETMGRNIDLRPDLPVVIMW